MKHINFGGTILWGNSLISRILFYLVVMKLFGGLLSCENKSLVVDTWRYQEGLTEKTVVDTIQDLKRFNNPYLRDIITIDSIISSSVIAFSNDTLIETRGLNINRTASVEVKTDTKNYFLFRGDIYGGGLHQNLNFIYEKDIGVVAYYVYGRGYVKLVSRRQGRKDINVNQTVYESMMESKILFPIQMPDTIKIYDISIQDGT